MQFLDCKSVNEKWGRFKRVILDVQDKLIPKVRKKNLRKQSPQWMNKTIRKCLRTATRVIRINIVICVQRLNYG